MERLTRGPDRVAPIAAWALPWACALAVSASVAFAVTANLSGNAYRSDTAAALVEQSSRAAFGTDDRSCDTSTGATLNWALNAWLLGRAGQADCPPRVSKNGLVSDEAR
jgi:hypothetical protein